MRIALAGAGSLGIIIGACTTRALAGHAGDTIDLVDTFQPNIDALRAKGAAVTGTYEFTVPVSALHLDELEGVYDFVIITTKQTALREMMPKLVKHLGKDSFVCTLQNGIPEELVAEYAGKERVTGCAVGWGATWLEPGVSRLTSAKTAMDNFAFDIGEMDGSVTPRIREAKRILEHTGHVEIITNLMSVRWTKVLMNATFSGMSAALACTFGDVLNDATGIQCIARLADETVRVAEAHGYSMAFMQGKDFNELKLKDKADIPGKFKFIHDVWDQHAALKASMLQDLEKGKPTEIDFIDGFVARKGREKGIPTPFCDKVVEMVKRQESSGKLNNFAMMSEFLPLL
jgi:2-dehydropantoate 2-reductase